MKEFLVQNVKERDIEMIDDVEHMGLMTSGVGGY